MAEGARYVPSTGARWAMLGAALVLAWLSVRSAVQNTFAYSDPEAGASFWPADGDSLAAMAQARVAASHGEIDDTTRSLVRAAIDREPLLADPLALAGLDAANRGDRARAEQLMLAARSRDPRSGLVRFWLFDHFVRSGQYGSALDEVGPAIRLQPDALTAVMTVLAAMADTPEGNKALATKLATRPFWEVSFFQTAANNSSPDALLALLSHLPDAGSALDEQRAVFMALINSGKGARAYEAWQRFLPATYRSRSTPVYDGNFGGWPGAAPFNWMLNGDNVGTARMVPAGDLPQSTALDVRYFGSTAGVLAQQYIHAAPGTYQLQVAARSRATTATGGRLSLELRCQSGDVLATLVLDPLGSQLRGFSAPVTVPAGCDLMKLQLAGAPGELFSEVEAQVTGVSLVPAS